jgi:hypothetical protein
MSPAAGVTHRLWNLEDLIAAAKHTSGVGESGVMDFLKIISKPAAWGSGWTSAVLCFSAAAGYWLAGEHRKAIFWVAFGAIEIVSILW